MRPCLVPRARSDQAKTSMMIRDIVQSKHREKDRSYLLNRRQDLVVPETGVLRDCDEGYSRQARTSYTYHHRTVAAVIASFPVRELPVQ